MASSTQPHCDRRYAITQTCSGFCPTCTFVSAARVNADPGKRFMAGALPGQCDRSFTY
ncbi:hypothetical protein H6F86_10460 [Phormidium sp. FACHB-592]|uniref:Uncharacterized protein n=1 Tax=Stenomitos frigidus AS-A4 TaxID=2933935 RepID=A0ABV0KUD4_9CYAN|nr:hypothetical protein [Phormidium sp. FACHB-592]MBD2074301.1 hypothetical protein [Phormidium sp. FACHB-592]